MHFHLIDQSINASFILQKGRPEVEVLRRDVRLEGSGKISLGRNFSQNPVELIEFARDRRSMYRV
jgi:hypothetical protein